MKKIILLLACIFFINLSYSISPGELNNTLLLNVSSNTEINFNKSYQQFKYQVLNLETNNFADYSHLKSKRRKKKNDDLMLYVAGGLAVATATLMLTNDPDNFTSNSASGVNLGIAVGGTIASGMIIVKYFIDKGR